MSPQRVAVLGASGSVGSQALEVIGRFPEHFELFGAVTLNTRLKLPRGQLIRAAEPDSAPRIVELVTHPACDLVLVAIPGAVALAPTLAALQAGKRVAIASKEVLVMAGDLIMSSGQGHLLRPVDSEHSAIWQCLWGEDPLDVSRLVLTSSGGPFWPSPELDLKLVTPAQAVAHPRWEMGPKVSVDSATLMNKGLELIEAHHLFGVPVDRIEVVVHPQSTVHSMVAFRDGTLKAVLSQPDMRIPIALALSYPGRLPQVVEPAAIPSLSPIEFYEVDPQRFPAVEISRRAALLAAGRPAALNAANEVAVAAFLDGRLPFSAIVPLVAETVERCPAAGGGLAGVLEIDRWARGFAEERLGNL